MNLAVVISVQDRDRSYDVISLNKQNRYFGRSVLDVVRSVLPYTCLFLLKTRQG
jgi:hypothetical protein